LTKHRLMLSAAAAALLSAATSAYADTEITTNTSAALTTATSGNIAIGTNGGVGITAASPTITINSNNSVNNSGFIANTGTSDATGIHFDTSVNGGVLVPPAIGFISTGTIDLAGGGTGKRGILISGGGTYYGPITLTGLTGATGLASQTSSMLIQGDTSVAFWLQQNTKVTSNILLGGGGIIQNASVNSTQSNSIVALLDGTVNGNFINGGQISAAGPGLIGIQVNGGINSCASAAGAAPAGFTCPTVSGGSFINSGVISLTGTGTPRQRGNNPESGSAVIIASSIAGGFVNAGPGTGSNVPVALIAANGIVNSGVVQPVVLIDPSKSVTALSPTPRGPAILGPVTSDVDGANAGYSFINRGAIQAQALDSQLSSAALIIQGSSSTYFTCLSASVGTCTGTKANPALNTGGLLSTGDISSTSTTNVTSRASGTVSAAAIYIGAFATVPRLDIQQQTVGGSTLTQGLVKALVSGIGQGTANAITIGENATVPAINIGKGASIIAQVETNTLTPPADVATAASPFALISQAIVDQGGSLKLINNAGSITAVNTVLTPSAGTVVVSVQRAIDLSASTTGGTTINNSGVMLGDVLFSAAGNNNVLNVGNTGAAETANATGVVNTPSNYAIIGESLISRPTTGAPSANHALVNFGSGTGHKLNVGAFGYMNADIRAGVGALDVTVSNNGILYIANTTNSLQANQFNVGTNATLGLAIAQANLNSLTPVVQANSANLTGANLALQFGTFISSGFTAAAVANPTVQTVTLIRAATITDTTLADQNAKLGQNTPFLFETPAESGIAPLSIGDSGGQKTLLLNLRPRSVNALNANGTPGLNLDTDTRNHFPFIAAALATDNDLGAGVATAMTVYNTPGVPGSGINVTASQQQAQHVFSQFAPDTSGGGREIAILITDQATGPVAARQRLLRQYGKVPGEMTLWGEEFTGQIHNKGRKSASGTTSSFKDHGFGFALGVDGGGPRNGWYGGAFTFYTGDVKQQLPRSSTTDTQWFMLSGYTHWQGKKLFLDTTISAAYGQFNTLRPLTLSGGTRIAESKHAGVMGAMGAKTGLMMRFLGIDTDPYVALDGLTLREEGYTEHGGGTGMNLQVGSYFANSLRTALGVDFKKTVPIWGFEITPGARVGYRYELLNQPVKVKAAFESTGGLATAGNILTFVGPDPDRGNTLLGFSLGAGTDTWHLGVNYDWLRGSNGSTTQVGTISVLGRI
jgi:hypothetical protein